MNRKLFMGMYRKKRKKNTKKKKKNILKKVSGDMPIKEEIEEEDLDGLKVQEGMLIIEKMWIFIWN